MFLKKLEVRCFRNYTRLCFTPPLKTLIVGDNGQGKTNLLEALVLLAGGSSFRVCTRESLLQEGEAVAFISAEVLNKNGKSLFQLSLDRTGKKTFLVNGKKSSPSQLSGAMPIIVFSPESLNLLKGSAERRRHWMDHWLNIRGRRSCVRDFNKALVQKNSVLKQIRKKELPPKKAQRVLESVNDIFIEKSLDLMRVRKQVLRDLDPLLEESKALIFGERSEKIQDFQTMYCMKGGEESKEEAEEIFRKKVVERSFLEQLAGTSLYGAHRDDFKLFFQGRDSRYFCSQGQQRALLLALKTAQVLWFHRVQKSSCLLLLDDVFSEIDKHIVLNLLHFLEEIPSQIILTSTKKSSFLNGQKFQVFNLKEGVLRKDFSNGRRTQDISPSFAPIASLSIGSE